MNASFLVASGSVNVADNTTRYVPISGDLVANATEANLETPIRDVVVFSNLYAYCSVNDAVAPSVTLSLSRSAKTLTVSWTLSQTGLKEDVNAAHNVTSVATDEAAYVIAVPSVSGSHSATFSVIGIQVAPSTAGNTIGTLVASGSRGFAAASSAEYYPPQGALGAQATGANTELRIMVPLTASNLWTNVTTNTRASSATTYNSRKNGAPGAQQVSYAASGTGQKEDTTAGHTDSLVSGDDFNYDVETGAGTGTITLTNISCRTLSTNKMFQFMAGSAPGVGQAFNVTTYYGVSGGLVASTTEAFVAPYPRFAMWGQYLSAMVLTNTIATSNTTIKTRDNLTADGQQLLTYAAGATGLKQDLDPAHADLWASGADELCYQVITPNTSGTFTILWISVVGTSAILKSVGVAATVAPSVAFTPHLKTLHQTLEAATVAIAGGFARTAKRLVEAATKAMNT